MERIIENVQNLYVFSMDLVKAFDQVERGAMALWLEHQTINREDQVCVHHAAVSKLRQLFPLQFACVFRKTH